MKKNVLVGLMLVIASLCVHAAPVPICNGGNTQQAVPVLADIFVKTGFMPRCSNNVIQTGEDKANYYATAAASQKGRSVYVGSTASGAIVIFDVFCTSGTSGNACSASDVARGQIAASAISN